MSNAAMELNFPIVVATVGCYRIYFRDVTGK